MNFIINENLQADIFVDIRQSLSYKDCCLMPT